MISRNLLAKLAGADQRLLAELEQAFRAVDESSSLASDSASATSALQDATVITLSPNDALANERVLKLGPGLKAKDDGTFLTISAPGFVRSRDYQAVMIAPGPVTLFLPANGTLISREVSGLRDYASDAAAATGGVPIGGLYHNAGAVRYRLA